jgi:transketolase
MNAREMRIDILKMALAAKSAGAHLGGSLSLVEVMLSLYAEVLRFNPKCPLKKRDRLIVSKGHGVMAQYAALKQLGVLTEADLLTYKATASLISAHPSVHQSGIGIDFASGSLGMGLSQGVGVALAIKRKGDVTSRVFVILGDGECDEGSVWESVAAGAHYGLKNLVAIVDRNMLQYDGYTEQVLSLDDFSAKWKAFGWDVVEVDGHDVQAVTSACNKVHEKPLVIVARTVKGRGVSFMENNPSWHHGIVTQKIYDQALAELR